MASFSSEIGKHFEEKGKETIQCLRSFLWPTRRFDEDLTNKATGTVFNFSTIKDKDPVERLREVNATFEETTIVTIPVASDISLL